MNVLEITIQRSTELVTPIVVEYRQSGVLPVRVEGKLELAGEVLLTHGVPLDYGSVLGKALFRDDVRDVFARALAKTGEHLHVLLFVEDTTLRSWHWERLCAPFDGSWDFLAHTQRTPFSLYLPSVADRHFPPIGRRELRALVVAASPADLDQRFGLKPFDVAGAVAGLQAGLGNIQHSVLAHASQVAGAVGPPTLDALAAYLTAEPVTLLHFVCHGQVSTDGETVIYLADGQNRAAPVTATQLIERLRRIGGVRGLPHFAFLSTCDSAQPEVEGALGGLGQRLVRDLGMPAVVAMTQKVSVATADALAAAFYPRLRAHGQPDLALVEAGAALADRHDIGVPALYSRLGGLPLFSDALDRELSQAEIEYGLGRLEELMPERAPVLIDSFGKEADALRGLLASDPSALSADMQAERVRHLAAINSLCLETADLTFNALAMGQDPPAYDLRCPFPGTRPFEATDCEFYFGREELVGRLVTVLNEEKLLVLAGPSGSGKTSLVLAGLIPKLHVDQPHMFIADLDSGIDPDTLREHAAVVQAESASVLVVDRLEEWLTLDQADERNQSLAANLLADIAARPVIVTMRDSFVDGIDAYPDLLSAIHPALQQIAPPAPTEFRAIIERQASAAGLRFEADLVNTLLDAMAAEPGGMSLLQWHLRYLWEHRRGRWLRSEAYRDLGGPAALPAAAAERVYLSSTEDDRLQLRNIFLRLVRLDEYDEGLDTRRRVGINELENTNCSHWDATRIANRLADECIVVTGVETATGGTQVDLVHRDLIRAWPRLKQWIDDDRAGHLVRQQIGEATVQWLANRRDRDYLLSGNRLEGVQHWADSHQDILSRSEQDFLGSSRAAQRAAGQRRIGIGAALLLLPIVAALIVMRIAGFGPFAPPQIIWSQVAGLGNQEIVDVMQSQNGALWVALRKSNKQPARVAHSDDNGERWSYRILTPEADDVTQIVESQVSSETLFAATADGSVFLSTDNGDTWVATPRHPPVERILSSLALSDKGQLFAGDFGGGVFMSSDNGKGWQLLTDCPLDGTNMLVWEDSILRIGSDAGLWQWSDERGCEPGAPDSVQAVFAVVKVDDKLYTAGTGGINAFSLKGGFESISAEKASMLSLVPGAPSILIGTAGKDLLWWRSDDDQVKPLKKFEGFAGRVLVDRFMEGQLWVVTSTGLYRGDARDWLEAQQ